MLYEEPEGRPQQLRRPGCSPEEDISTIPKSWSLQEVKDLLAASQRYALQAQNFQTTMRRVV